MKKILYIGNKLSHHGFIKGVIETLGPQLISEGFQVTYAGTRKNVLLRMIEMIMSVIRNSRKVDYVLIDTYSTSAFWFAWLTGVLCRLLSIKYIHILHGGGLPIRLQNSQKACKIIFDYSYANVAVSGYLKEAFERAGYPTVVIPNNIDISQYRFTYREYLKPRILWVRSFHRKYNPNMAADVLNLLLKHYPESVLCMVGPDKDGSMKEFKDYCNKLGISDHVTVTGLLSKPEWHQVSKEYDIFINTTSVDNTPVSVIEAMALGLVVVSTDVDGLPYLLENNKDAILINQNDAKAMADSIINLIENKIFVFELIKNARKKAEDFDWNNVKNKWMELLK